MNTEGLKGKIEQIRGNIQNAWNKTSKADKDRIKEDLKNKNYSGAAEIIKKNFDKGTT